MTNDSYRTTLYRTIAALGVVLAFLFTLVIPQHMRESIDWSLQYGVQNFADGQLTVDSNTLGLERAEIAQYGGVLDQYAPLGNGRWGLTEAPGYVFYLLPFYFIHAPRLGNLLLALGMAAVAYLLLRRMKDEKTACIGSLLLIFTPVALAMMQRDYANGFGAAAFLTIGGGLYIYYRLRHAELSLRKAGLLLFLAGLFLGLSVASDYFNALVVLVFVLHFAYVLTRSWLDGRHGVVARSALWMAGGLVLPLAGLLVYQNAVFGSPWLFGFEYIQLAAGFGLHYVEPNIDTIWVALLAGFPLLLPGLAALGVAAYQKLRRLVTNPGEVTDGWPEIPGDILLLLAGWLAAVYGLYLCYQWTASGQLAGMPFIVMVRYYLPGALPLVLLGILWLERAPRKLWLLVTAVAFIWGVVFFAQSALSYPVVPPHSPYNPTAAALSPDPCEHSLLSVDNLNIGENTFDE